MEKAIGFIGLGEMGYPMAKNLINAGYKLNVYDIDKKSLRQIEKIGAQVAKSPMDVAACSEMVIIAVRTTSQVEQIIKGEKGVLANTGQLETIIVVSTIDPLIACDLAEQSEKKGLIFLDAPISGGKERAGTGDLTIMVGGSESGFQKYKKIFDVLGSHTFYLGDSGMGQYAKLINNMLLLVNMCAVHEAKNLANKVGLKSDTLFDLLKVSTGDSWVVNNWQIVRSWKEDYQKGGTLDLLYKDIDMTLSVAEIHEIPMFLSSLAKQLVRYK
ncbi:NAD(P)-dependent oxidoreductase [Desulfobacula sp.]|uniref:NAD(P)-dependent oxidoreductase n=1 Tax=Desulfobacula sp. TaxID=2593537 RepID=UPI00260887E4|nr:NAD(P)-dependent oxidoreductase [Desulfobacula sp.]